MLKSVVLHTLLTKGLSRKASTRDVIQSACAKKNNDRSKECTERENTRHGTNGPRTMFLP